MSHFAYFIPEARRQRPAPTHQWRLNSRRSRALGVAPRFRRSMRKPAAVPVRATRITSTGACAKGVGTVTACTRVLSKVWLAGSAGRGNRFQLRRHVLRAIALRYIEAVAEDHVRVIQLGTGESVAASVRAPATSTWPKGNSVAVWT